VVTKPLGFCENRTHGDPQPHTRVQARFGAFAQRYVTSEGHAQGEDLERLIAVAQPEPGWLALDIATGGGHTALRFAPWVARVIATDLTARMLLAARTHVHSQGAENITFGVADAQDLPFPARHFDLVTCRIAPHHFHDCARFVREGARVLKPGGRFLVQDHVLPEDRTAARYIDAFERLRDPSHNCAYAQSEWIELLKGAGLRVEHTEQLVKRHDFLSWAQRQDCSTETIEQLVEMVYEATESVVEWMQLQGFERRTAGERAQGAIGATFANRHIILLGHKGNDC
jgi:ubiquinone/menaquinone biosynthesis C-methylase UbiE